MNWEFSVGKRTFTNGNSSKFFYSAEGEKLRGSKKGKATYEFVHEKGLLCANLFKKKQLCAQKGDSVHKVALLSAFKIFKNSLSYKNFS